MSFRTITVASTTKSAAKQLQTEATTWGQLKDSLRSEFGDLDKMRAVVRETRNDLTSDDAILPEDSFTLLLTPKQIKAGSTKVNVASILEDVKQAFIDSIDDIISEVHSGVYDTTEKVVSKVKSVSTSDSLLRELDDLKNGKF